MLLPYGSQLLATVMARSSKPVNSEKIVKRCHIIDSTICAMKLSPVQGHEMNDGHETGNAHQAFNLSNMSLPFIMPTVTMFRDQNR